MSIGRNEAPIYRLDGVSKAYPNTVAIDDISLSIRDGELAALVGPSGSGKTSLLHLMAGIVPPDSGAISLINRDLASMKPGKELSSLVGMIHQQFDIVPHLSVVHNVLAGRLGRWSLLKSIISLVSPVERNLAVEALERVGISDKMRALYPAFKWPGLVG